MPLTMTAREFNHDTGRAKRAAADGPVFITDRGTPAHVLLSIEEYRRLAGAGKTLLDAIAMPGRDDIVFDPPKAHVGARPATFD